MKVFEKHLEYGNPLVEKSFNFSVRVVKFYKHALSKDRSVEPLFKQFLRSGTSIGANISESQSATSKKDFVHKLSISLKEVRESEYWLKLFVASDFITNQEFKSLSDDLLELYKLLTTIIKKAKINP